MKKFLKIATKKHLFEQLHVGWKILITCVLLVPIITVAISSILIQSSIRGIFEMASLSTDTGLQAKIIIDQATWYDSHDLPPASLGLSLTKGMAPFSVLFQGWQSTPDNEIVDYLWDFGDSGSSHNIMHGFNSAHVFEKPGDYIVKLTIKNRNGTTATTQVTINVVARTGQTYYVDPNGDDYKYSGKCSVITENIVDPDGKICGPWRTAERAFVPIFPGKIASSVYGASTTYAYGDSILFKSGGSYEFSIAATSTKSASIYPKGLYFGAYGAPGNKPVIQYNNSTSSWMLINASRGGSYDITFADLNFKLKNPASSARLGGIYRSIGQTKNVTFLRLDVEDPSSSFFGFPYVAKTDPVEDESIHSGLFMIDSKLFLNHYGKTAEDPDFKGGELIYGFIRNFALIGNTFDHSFNHIAYMSHLHNSIIIDNVFSRPAFGRNALRISGDLVNKQGSRNIYISNNYFLGWIDPIPTGVSYDNGGDPHNGNGIRYNFQLLTLGPNNPNDQELSNVVFEKNIITNYEKAIMVADTSKLVMRNNIFMTPNNIATTNGTIVFGNWDWEFRPLKDVSFVGNVVGGMTTGTTPLIYLSPLNRTRGMGLADPTLDHQNVKIANNIFYHPQEGKSNVNIQLLSNRDSFMRQLNFDGNVYFNQRSVDGKTFKIGSALYDLNGWKALGYNYDSISTSQIKPLFVQEPILYNMKPGEPATLQANIDQANAYREMFKLKDDPANPAIDRGDNYFSSVLFNDMYGNERPDGGWLSGGKNDAGAYELVKIANIPPIALMSFSPVTGIAPAEINFDATGSSDSDGTISSYTWDFGDGSTASGITTKHVYALAGNYQISLNVTDNRGGSSLKNTTIEITPPCEPVWNCDPNWSACVNSNQSRTCTNSCDNSTKIETQNCTCVPIETCGEWSSCVNGNQTQTCTNSCDSTINTKNQSCTCTSSWSCGSWSACNGTSKTRTCHDTSPCGAADFQESASCIIDNTVGNGLKGSYFTNQILAGSPALIRTDANVNFAWSRYSPDPLIPTDSFSVRWEGQIKIPTGGNYTFYTYTDDGVKLWIDGQLIINHWVGQAETEWSGSINLAAGKHDIKMEYFEALTYAIAKLSWSGPDISKSIIPQSNLYSASCNENWVCTWGPCIRKKTKQSCIDQNQCGTTSTKPIERTQRCN